VKVLVYKECLFKLIRKVETFLCKLLPDVIFIAYQYGRRHKKILNLKNPVTFNQKIQWLKLNYRLPLLRKLVDKYEVRNYVEDKIGTEVLVDLIGIYEKVDEIDWYTLPSRFVLKMTHGSGWNILCRDKKTLDIIKAKKQLYCWYNDDFYKYQREWAYKGLKPRIICERFLADEEGEPPTDYKFFCFNGVPKLIQVDSDRFIGHHRALYDLKWNRLPFSLKYPASPNNNPPPKNLDKMIDVAKKLSDNLLFVRVDLYSLNHKIYFGEMTIYPGGGLEHFKPDIYDRIIGDTLKLPFIKQT